MNHGMTNLSVDGTGDVLSGICASMLSQGLNINDAAFYSTYLLGECSQLYSKNISNYGLTPSKIINIIPDAMDSINALS